MDTGTGYYGHVAVAVGIVRGIAPLGPVLEIQLKIQADGFAPGVAAMILASCQVQGAKLSADLGKAETIITQLGFGWREDDTPYKTSEFARWRLTQADVEHLERVRDGGNLALSVTPEVVLLNHGESVPGLYPRPEGVHRPNTSPHSPIRHTGQEQLDIPAETWARQVLTPWQQAAAVTLVVKLPEGTATDDHRTVIRDLTDARQRLDKGDWKGSIRASRDAVEVLRGMHDEHLSPRRAARRRTAGGRHPRRRAPADPVPVRLRLSHPPRPGPAGNRLDPRARHARAGHRDRRRPAPLLSHHRITQRVQRECPLPRYWRAGTSSFTDDER